MNAPRRPHVVIIGGGFGGLETAKALGNESVEVTLVDRNNHHLFQPLLYQVAMAGLSPAEIAIPIRAVVGNYRNVDVLMGNVVDIDIDNRRVELEGGDRLPYDYLVFAVGARTSYFGHDDWETHAPGLKSLDDALEIRRRVLLAFERAERETDADEKRRLLTFVVIGGGPTGVELAGAVSELARRVLAQDFHHIDFKEVRVVLVEGTDRVLGAFTPELSKSAAEQLAALGVELALGSHVSAIDDAGVVVGDRTIPARTVIWGAGVAPSPLAAKLGVPLDRRGRVVVGPDCSVPGHPEVFAVGDVAAFATPDGGTLPGVSPVAMQQGHYVADIIVRRTPLAERNAFDYVDKGMMATIGRSRAVAQTKRLRFTGFTAWLAWLFVHIWYLVGFKNRVFVLMQWVVSYVFYRRGARLITGQSQRSATKLRS